LGLISEEFYEAQIKKYLLKYVEEIENKIDKEKIGRIIYYTVRHPC